VQPLSRISQFIDDSGTNYWAARPKCGSTPFLWRFLARNGYGHNYT
jgi:hypothetical protein